MVVLSTSTLRMFQEVALSLVRTTSGCGEAVSCHLPNTEHPGRPVTQIVHFDLLKPCPASVRIATQPVTYIPSDQHINYGENVQLVEDDSQPQIQQQHANEGQSPQPASVTQRYPRRTRRPPDRLGN